MRNIVIVFTILSIIFIVSCTKDSTLILQQQPQDINKSVSLSKDILPIFEKNCDGSACHSSGGHQPYVASKNIYSSLINGNFVDTKTPLNSTIYLRLTGKLIPAMPMGQPSNPSDINDLILAWVKQGAKDN
jgi:hypothetical protein